MTIECPICGKTIQLGRSSDQVEYRRCGNCKDVSLNIYLSEISLSKVEEEYGGGLMIICPLCTKVVPTSIGATTKVVSRICRACVRGGGKRTEVSLSKRQLKTLEEGVNLLNKRKA